MSSLPRHLNSPNHFSSSRKETKSFGLSFVGLDKESTPPRSPIRNERRLFHFSTPANQSPNNFVFFSCVSQFLFLYFLSLTWNAMAPKLMECLVTSCCPPPPKELVFADYFSPPLTQRVAIRCDRTIRTAINEVFPISITFIFPFSALMMTTLSLWSCGDMEELAVN